MKLTQAQEEKLFDYVDGTLIGAERENFEKFLANNPAAQTRIEEINKLNNALRTIKIEQPSKNFTQQVMNKLHESPASRRTFSSFNGILLLAGVLAAVGIGSLLLAGGVFDGSSNIQLNQTIIPEKYIPQSLPSIPFNGKLIVNVIIMLNLALAFLVLDRAILKPWFEKRSRLHGHA